MSCDDLGDDLELDLELELAWGCSPDGTVLMQTSHKLEIARESCPLIIRLWLWLWLKLTNPLADDDAISRAM